MQVASAWRAIELASPNLLERRFWVTSTVWRLYFEVNQFLADDGSRAAAG